METQNQNDVQISITQSKHTDRIFLSVVTVISLMCFLTLWVLSAPGQDEAAPSEGITGESSVVGEVCDLSATTKAPLLEGEVSEEPTSVEAVTPTPRPDIPEYVLLDEPDTYFGKTSILGYWESIWGENEVIVFWEDGTYTAMWLFASGTYEYDGNGYITLTDNYGDVGYLRVAQAADGEIRLIKDMKSLPFIFHNVQKTPEKIDESLKRISQSSTLGNTEEIQMRFIYSAALQILENSAWTATGDSEYNGRHVLFTGDSAVILGEQWIPVEIIQYSVNGISADNNHFYMNITVKDKEGFITLTRAEQEIYKYRLRFETDEKSFEAATRSTVALTAPD